MVRIKARVRARVLNRHTVSFLGITRKVPLGIVVEKFGIHIWKVHEKYFFYYRRGHYGHFRFSLQLANVKLRRPFKFHSKMLPKKKSITIDPVERPAIPDLIFYNIYV